jgi:hypothetical protein
MPGFGTVDEVGIVGEQTGHLVPHAELRVVRAAALQVLYLVQGLQPGDVAGQRVHIISGAGLCACQHHDEDE